MSGNARLGPIHLAPGIRPGHATTYLYATFAGITLSTFVGAFLPYILNVNMAVPMDQQGGVAGDMGFYREIVLIVSSTLIGALSDRTGRRIIFVGGLFVLATLFLPRGIAGLLRRRRQEKKAAPPAPAREGSA